MKKIEVIFQPEKLEELKDKLMSAGVSGSTVYQIYGCGNQHGWVEYHRGTEVMMNMLPKVYMMITISDEKLDETIAMIEDCLWTGEVGDGKIFISTIDDCIRIRTREHGEKAL